MMDTSHKGQRGRPPPRRGDLAEVLAEEPTHLVGHSYGGVASLIAAAQVPGSVQSLTVSSRRHSGWWRTTQRFVALSTASEPY
jgi:pimeloyl-ACP methyl ester carboxylesterase